MYWLFRDLQPDTNCQPRGIEAAAPRKRLADEEHRRVVADEIPVAFLGVELHREAAHVALRIGGTQVTRDGREPHEQRRDLANFGEDLRARVLGDVVRDRERAVAALAFRVNDALGDALAVLMGELFE